MLPALLGKECEGVDLENPPPPSASDQLERKVSMQSISIETECTQMGKSHGAESAQSQETLDAKSTHGIVRSSQHLGHATSALLLISTLTFGFAIAAIVELTAARTGQPLLSDSIVLLCLSGAASLSVITTTFGLLEYYYIEMFAGADQRCRSIDVGCADALEVEFKEALSFFNPHRAKARNAMWGALVLTQLAAAVQLNRDLLTEFNMNPGSKGLHIWGDFLASMLQFVSIFSVIRAVQSFRSVYRPLLSKYRLGFG